MAIANRRWFMAESVSACADLRALYQPVPCLVTEYVGEVRVPAPSTLRRYGLTRVEWEAILAEQGGVCGVCRKVPASGTLHIDHDHARGWRKLKPEERRRYVRGLTCFIDNAVFLRRGATPERLRAAADYLEKYLTNHTENQVD